MPKIITTEKQDHGSLSNHIEIETLARCGPGREPTIHVREERYDPLTHRFAPAEGSTR